MPAGKPLVVDRILAVLKVHKEMSRPKLAMAADCSPGTITELVRQKVLRIVRREDPTMPLSGYHRIRAVNKTPIIAVRQ